MLFLLLSQAELDLLAGANENGVRTQARAYGHEANFTSAFRACNLSGALEIVRAQEADDDKKKETKEEKKETEKEEPRLKCEP